MSKLLKYLFIVTGGLIAFAALIVVGLFTLIDPDRYRGVLEDLVAARTGMELSVDGDIAWSFRPTFGLSISDVRLDNSVSPQELASFSSVSLSLDPMALLGGRLDMEELRADDLTVNWFVDSNGRVNWLAGLPDQPRESNRPRQVTDIPVTVDIQRIDINNASLSLRDLSRGLDASLENLDISSRNTNLDNRPFALEIGTRLVDRNSNRDIDMRLTTEARLDYAAGNLALEDLSFNLSPLVLEGQLAVSDFHAAPTWEGNLASNTFNLHYLLEQFLPVDAGPGIDNDNMQFSTEMAFDGDSRGATVSAMRMTLDDMQAELSGDLLYATDNRPLTVAYRLDAGTLNLDRMLSPLSRGQQSPDEDAGDTAPGTDAEPVRLPFETLSGVNIRGDHRIDALQYAGLVFEDIDTELRLEDGVLDLESQPIGFHGGQIVPGLHLDSTVSPAQIDVTAQADGVATANLGQTLRFLRPLSGSMDLSSEHSMRGDTTQALAESITGLTRFSVTDGTADIAMVKRVFSALSVLSPSGNMAEDWPDRLEFNELEGRLLFNEGLASGQELSLQMDNLDISGEGGIDLVSRRFDYDIDVTVLGEPAPQTLRVNEDYRGVAWPIECSAGFDSPPAQYCGPDLQRAREVFARLTRDEIQRRAGEVISDQVDDLRERARDLLDNLRN